MATFRQRPEFDRAAFAKRLEGAAWFYVNSNAATRDRPEAPPSEDARRWRALASKVNDLVCDFQRLDYVDRGNLEEAARQMAKKVDHKLPDFEPERWELEPIPNTGPRTASWVEFWPAERQIDKALDLMVWLRRAVVRAAERADAEVATPGNRADEPLHQFVRTLVDLPRVSAADLDEREVVAAYLDACLTPLHLPDARDATARRKAVKALYDRAVGKGKAIDDRIALAKRRRRFERGT
ncbi:MAG: hypothetical protein WEB06_00565 [Actinomycetota bacterium]